MKVTVLAHRGGSAGRFPENSISAFLAGITAGADVLELDVRLSRDGRVAVIHDEAIDRVCGENGAVSELTLSELQSHPMRDGAGTVHRDCRISPLDDVLERCSEVHFNIDLKTAEPSLARSVYELLGRYGALSRATVASFLPEALEYFRSIAPEVRTSAHPGEVKALLRARFSGGTVDTPAQAVQIPRRYGIVPLATRGFIRFLHRRDFNVDVWTLNDTSSIRAAALNGVDGIVTDDVALARNVLTTLRSAQ
ncbi:MAG: hypothetical protein MI724_15690 [Spirochaetales bacterium]|nr:hypothetical protein [Spirochaetales bacterium]